MKKLFAILYYSFFFTTLSSAQIQFGPKAGLIISNLNGNERNFESKLGFEIGALFTYSFNDYLAVQPEIYYTTKGAKDTTIETEVHSLTILLDYIEVPILFKFSYPLKSYQINPSVYLGPAFSFKTGANIREDVGGLILEGSYNYVKTVDYSLVFGGSVGFQLKKSEYGLDIRYVMGMTSIYDRDKYDFDVKNRTLSFSIYMSSSF